MDTELQATLTENQLETYLEKRKNEVADLLGDPENN